MFASVQKIAVLASGGGTNLQALIDAQKAGFFQSKIGAVISDKEDAYALIRAKENNIPAYVIRSDEDIVKILDENHIDLVVLAGYLKILGKKLLNKYEGRIINIHPSLLPKYGGRGMYGLNVHRAVFEAGEEVSGATVHYVNEVIDGGGILLQEKVDIRGLTTPAEIQKKVLEAEHRILKQAIRKIEEEE